MDGRVSDTIDLNLPLMIHYIHDSSKSPFEVNLKRYIRLRKTCRLLDCFRIAVWSEYDGRGKTLYLWTKKKAWTPTQHHRHKRRNRTKIERWLHFVGGRRALNLVPAKFSRPYFRRGIPGIEPGTSRTRSEHNATIPNPRVQISHEAFDNNLYTSILVPI